MANMEHTFFPGLIWVAPTLVTNGHVAMQFRMTQDSNDRFHERTRELWVEYLPGKGLCPVRQETKPFITCHSVVSGCEQDGDTHETELNTR